MANPATVSTKDPNSPVEVRDVHYITESVESYLADDKKISQLREMMIDGQIVIFKKFASNEEIQNLKKYLHNIQTSSIPNFFPITAGTPNNYRINFDDPRAQVRAFFHVWSFFAWNQDLFSLYERYKHIFHLRNRFCELPPETFLGYTPDHGCAARLSVQYYPSGKGYFTSHMDPIAIHQLAVPIMPMSKIGKDFNKGGNYVMRLNGEKVSTEEMTEAGDILLFNARCVHGVDIIDENANFEPMSPSGRWMMLFAVNKLAGNTAIENAVAQNNAGVPY